MGLNKKINETHIIGGYTSYLRYMVEPCTIDAKECDIQNMEMLGVSKFNPLYIFEMIINYFSKKNI